MLALFLWGMYIIEVWPRAQPAILLQNLKPPYVEILKNAPNTGSVWDMHNPPPIAMYLQTLHEKPLPDGYVARWPLSISNRRGILSSAWQQKDFFTICQTFKIRYLITHELLEVTKHSYSTLYDNGEVRVLDLNTLEECSNG